MTFTCRALLLDLDGVLVDSTEVIRRNWTRWAERHGLEAAQVVRSAQGRRTIETVRLVAPHLDAEAEALGLVGDEATETEGVREVPGARELLAALPVDAWAVVTSAVRSAAEARLRYAGLRVPAVLVAADEVANGKPHPEGYLAAARRLGVSAADCIVVEDAPAGIEAAHAGGMRVLGVPTSHEASELAGADLVARSLGAIRVHVQDGRLELAVPPA
ncbi:MAG TPA: HAD-IA family hydrolase [Longimicrobiales bacterium]